MSTNKIIPHVFIKYAFGGNGAKSAKAFMKRKCRRALRRALKVMENN